MEEAFSLSSLEDRSRLAREKGMGIFVEDDMTVRNCAWESEVRLAFELSLLKIWCKALESLVAYFWDSEPELSCHAFMRELHS